MKRPFYIYTPRNIYGESLVGDSHLSPAYEIKDVHSKLTHSKGKDLEELKERVKKLNDIHEIELAYAMYI